MWSLALLLCVAVVYATQPINIATSARGSQFDGVGALSAGTGPRLLIDYPDPYRSHILDYMFLPNFGASFQVLKIEIGGTGQSTDGTESTHEAMPGVYDWNTGYEWWLAKEALSRNPNIVLYGLPWTFPGWLQDQAGDPVNNSTVLYIADWVAGAKQFHNLTLHYLGFHNESPWKADLVILLRSVLDARGLQATRLVLGDAGPGPYFQSPDLLDQLAQNTQLSQAVDAVGWHYPVEILPVENNISFWQQFWSISQKKWASEDFSTYSNKMGGNCWAKLLNRNFVVGNMTSTLAWDSIAAWYDWLPFAGDGLMFAMEPWSGYYKVPEAIWATAHTTQFCQPGWFYLRNNSGSGILPGGGSYVTLVSPTSNDLSIVVETMDGASAQCAYEGTNTSAVPDAQSATFCFDLQFCKAHQMLYEWRTRGSKDEYFVLRPSRELVNCCISLTLHRNSIYTLTTIATAQKGSHHSPPPSQPFPFPYETTFTSEKDRFGDFAHYFTDQGGIFRVAESPFKDGDALLTQTCVIPPVGSFGPKLSGGDVNPEPVTVLGSTNWTDYTVSVTGRLNDTDAPFAPETVLRVGGRLGNGWYIFSNDGRAIWGYWLSWSSAGAWSLNVSNQKESFSLSSGNEAFDLSASHNLTLRFDGASITGYLDSVKVASVSDATFSSGAVGLGCGWHSCWFSSFGATFNQDDLAEENRSKS